MNTMKKILCLLTLVVHCIQGKFILTEVNMNDATFQACQSCDDRSDEVGSNATATALREFMKKNFIKIVIDGGEVKVRENYPNEGINTGHSCKYTAEARNIVAEAKMLPGSVELEPFGILFLDKVRNSIAVADAAHELVVNLDVRVKSGLKVFGKCHRLWRKTCSTTGKSTGINKISANFAASNVLVECIGGQEHLTFNMDATVIDEAKGKTYGDVTVDRRGDCDLDILGIKIGSINGKVQSYASRYANQGNKFSELRGPKLVAELQRKLGARLGSVVSIKINDENGNPRTCNSRRKRSTSCGNKRCPDGFNRVGDTDVCQKYIGLSKPDCKKFGNRAKLVEKLATDLGNLKIYYCQLPMQ